MLKLYQELALLVVSINNCRSVNNTEWEHKHTDKIKTLTDKYLPSGAGFDSGTQFDLDKSTENRLIFHTSYHHMDDNGYYDGWTEHDIIVTPSLPFDFTLQITGSNRNYIKDYIAECIEQYLHIDIER